MINFRDPKDQIPSLLAVAGMVLMAASVVGLFILPSIKVKANTGETIKQIGIINQAKNKAKDDRTLAEGLIAKQVWSVKIADVTPVALARISQLVSSTNLNLISFRPQKAVESSALVQLQYNLAVDGPYTSVATLLDKIERSDAKLAVNSVQYASAEGETDKVTATIGLVAFAEIPKKGDPKKSG